MRKIIITTFLLNISLACFAFAEDYGKVNITEMQQVDASSGVLTKHGYAEYRYLVQNRDNVPHKVKLSLEPSMYGGYGVSLVSSTDTVEVAAGSYAVLRLFQPPIRFGANNQETKVSIDGWARDPKSTHVTHMNTFTSVNNNAPVVFVSQQTPTTTREFFTRRTTQKPDDGGTTSTTTSTTTTATSSPVVTSMHSPTVTPTAPPTLTLLLSNVSVDEWSDSWLSYTRFDCVVMTSDEWGGAVTRKPAVLSAVKRYVEAGGILVILGKDWEVPAEWKPIFDTSKNKKPSESDKFDKTVVCGKVFVLGRTGTEVAESPHLFDDVIKSIDSNAVSEKARLDLAQRDEHGRGYGGGYNESTISRMHNILPVVTKYGVNIRLVLVLIILFAVLIGPVNVFVLRSLNRRIWLIWTVPATSLLASFLVLLASFLSEGLLKQASSLTYTVLDQRRDVATTFGFIGYYSTFSTGSPKFSSDIELLPFCDSNSWSVELQVDGSGNQVLLGSWILPRVPAYFSLRKNQLQQKLNVNFNWSDAEKPTATNGLGVKINHISVCSPTGEIFEADSIEAGEQKVLTRAGRPISKLTEAEFYNSLRTNQQTFLSNASSVMSNQMDLFPGSYRAEIKDWNPFVEKGIQNLKSFEHKTQIIGIYQ
ncbi:MAG: hypothetical protein LBK06_10565 [Planctomycetaceae bacterium]|jgi:hypothetical protein|nr:hypothetical protein [Planctomycetaceae bacterium]